MGVDFIRSPKKPFVKAWKDGLDRLKEPKLFEFEMGSPRRAVNARLLPGMTAHPGQEVIAQLDGQALVLCRGLDKVARVDDAPAAVLSTIAALGGVAGGSIERVGTFGNTIEVTLR